MKLTTSSAASLREALCKIVELYSGEDDQLVSTDFYLMPLREEGALRVFNDNDEEIAVATVPEWADYVGEDFYREVEANLQNAIREKTQRLRLQKVFSFS